MRHSPERHWFLIAYDVANDKNRAKIAKCLEGYGERLQYSVFRAFLSDRALARLRWELGRKISKEDGLLIVHLCPACQARVQDQKGNRDWRDEAPLGFRIAGRGVKDLSSDPGSSSTSPCPERNSAKSRPKRSMTGSDASKVGHYTHS